MNNISNHFHTTGLLLHAAAVLSSKGVFLLLGHSGSGKTTLSRLLSDHFKILKDDRAFLQLQKNNQWFVYINDDMHNPITLNDNSTYYPLHAIIRIFGTQETKLEPLLPIKTCEYLMDAVFEIDTQQQSRSVEFEKQWFAQTAHIARQCPGWKLQFSLQLPVILHELQQCNII